jgi:hypothetical protein
LATNATTTNLYISGALTLNGSGTSTFSGGISASTLNITGLSTLGALTFTNATGTALSLQSITSPNGIFGNLTATNTAVLSSTTAYGRIMVGSILATSTATSSLSGALAVSNRTSINSKGQVTAAQFDVTSTPGVSYDFDYDLDGTSDTSNPTITLVRGATYNFNLNTPGHPFYLKTIQSTGTGNQYTSGVTNNGATNGTVTFTVPMNAPSTLYYNCSIHSAMTGVINVLDVTSPSQTLGSITSTSSATLASTTLYGQTVVGNLISTSTATSTFGGAITVASGQGTSTFASGLSANILNITSTTASSTFANGLNLTGGCFAINGTCVSGGGGGSGTVGSGTIGQFPYYAAGGTTLTATSTIFVGTNSYVGIGTTTPTSALTVNGDITVSGSIKIAGTASSTTVNTISLSSQTAGLFQMNGYLYRVSNAGVLETFSLASSTNASSTSTFNLNRVPGTTGPGLIAGSGNLLYVVEDDGGGFGYTEVEVIDVSNPYAPVSKSIIATGLTTGVSKVFATGQYVYVYGKVNLNVYRVADPTAPTFLVARFIANDVPFDIKVVGNYAYLTALGGSLYILDITNQANPVLKSTTAQSNNGQSVEVLGDYTYNLNRFNIDIFDISNKSAPILKSIKNISSNATGVKAIAASSNYVYYLDATIPGTIFTVNVSDPSNMFIEKTLTLGFTSGEVVDMVMRGRYIYVTGSIGGSRKLKVIDIGGSTMNSLSVASLEASKSLITGDQTVLGTMDVTKLNVGAGGLYSGGGLSATGTISFMGNTVSTTGNYLCYNTTTKLITNGTTCTLSSSKFKTDIEPLGYATSTGFTNALDEVMALKPVKFKFINGYGDDGASDQLGFIAEDVYKVDPRLTPLDASGAPAGFYYQQYEAILTQAIQELNVKLDIISTSTSFVSNRTILDSLGYYAGQLVDGVVHFAKLAVDSITAKSVKAQDEVCIGSTCVTESQLKSMLNGSPASSVQSLNVNTSSNSDTQAPTLTLIGSSTITLSVGTSYIDSGATVSDNKDTNLGVKASVDGSTSLDISQISIDTSTTSVHTIEYSATDSAGNKALPITRTITVE